MTVLYGMFPSLLLSGKTVIEELKNSLRLTGFTNEVRVERIEGGLLCAHDQRIQKVVALQKD